MNLRIFSILAAILFIMGVVIVLQHRSNVILRNEKEELVNFSVSDARTIQWYKNNQGRQTAKITVLDLSNRNLRALKQSDKIKWIKQFKGVKNNLRNVDEINSIDLEFDKTFRVPLSSDTTPADTDNGFLSPQGSRSFAYHDSLNSVIGVIRGDTAILKLSIDATLQGAIYWQRNRFLGLRIGRKRWFNELTCLNPNVTIKGLENIKIGRKRH